MLISLYQEFEKVIIFVCSSLESSIQIPPEQYFQYLTFLEKVKFRQKFLRSGETNSPNLRFNCDSQILLADLLTLTGAIVRFAHFRVQIIKKRIRF